MKGQHEEAAHTAVGQEVEPGDHGGNRMSLSELYKTDRWVKYMVQRGTNSFSLLYIGDKVLLKGHDDLELPCSPG